MAALSPRLNLKKGNTKMAKTISAEEAKAFRKAKREARQKLNALRAAGQITGPEFNKRVNALGKLKVGQAIPASLTAPSASSTTTKADSPKTGGDKASPTLPVPPPAGRKKKNKKEAETTTRPVPPPEGRKTKRKPKLYTTIDPRTGKVVDKKVPAAKHLSNIEAFEKREKAGTVMTEAEAKSGEKTAKKVLSMLTKKDYRSGGMVLSTVDNRRKK